MKKWNEELWLLTPEELWLLTPEEYGDLQHDVTLKCVDNTLAKKCVDYIDQDTRFGCIAYGLTKELVDSQKLEHDFLVMLPKS